MDEWIRERKKPALKESLGSRWRGRGDASDILSGFGRLMPTIMVPLVSYRRVDYSVNFINISLISMNRGDYPL